MKIAEKLRKMAEFDPLRRAILTDAADALASAAADVERLERENAELREALTELKPAEVLVEGSYFPVGDLPKVLGNFMRSSAEYSREVKDWMLKSAEMKAERDAALAQIEQVRALATPEPSSPDLASRMANGDLFPRIVLASDVLAILSTSPAEALNAVKAAAWDEGLDAGRDRWMDSREFGDKPVNPYRTEAN